LKSTDLNASHISKTPIIKKAKNFKA